MPAKEFQLCGLGNAIVDIFVEVSDAEFAGLGFGRGTMRLVDLAEQQALLARFRGRDPRLVSGGSVANSVIGFAQLGGDAAFLGCVADDRYGLHYAEEFAGLGIDFANPPRVGGATGTCVALVTPDAERTMRTCLAASSELGPRHVDAAKVGGSEWLFAEGYLLANPEHGQGAVREAVRLAERHGTKVALTCSEAFIAEAFAEPFAEALGRADLLFCNAAEACAVTGAADAAAAFARLKDRVPAAVVTDGPHGAHVRFGGVEAHVPAFPCTPKDLTGAGDMFAGAFLYGVTHGVPPDRAARAACYLAQKVISQVGARLHHGARRAWDEALAGA